MASLVTQAGLSHLNERSLKILAKSIFRELKQNGYDSRHIVSLSTELISLVTSDLRGEDPSSPNTPQ